MTQRLPAPAPEFPADDVAGNCGSLAFLYLHAPHSASWAVRALDLVLRLPCDLFQLHFFSQGGLARAGCISAHLSDEAEAELRNGDPLAPSQWRSGPKPGLMDIVAHYGRGGGILRSFVQGLPEKIERLRYMRVDASSELKKLDEFKRRDTGVWYAPGDHAQSLT